MRMRAASSRHLSVSQAVSRLLRGWLRMSCVRFERMHAHPLHACHGAASRDIDGLASGVQGKAIEQA